MLNEWQAGSRFFEEVIGAEHWMVPGTAGFPISVATGALQSETFRSKSSPATHLSMHGVVSDVSSALTSGSVSSSLTLSDSCWNQSNRLQITEALVREAEPREGQYDRRNPFFTLLQDRDHRRRLLPHLILDHRTKNGRCVLSALLAELRTGANGTDREPTDATPLLVENLHMYGYDVENGFNSDANQSSSIAADVSRNWTSVLKLIGTVIPSSVAMALISLPTTTVNRLELDSMLSYAAYSKDRAVIQLLLQKGCNPNTALPCHQIIDASDDRGRGTLSMPLVASLALEMFLGFTLPPVLSWLEDIAQHGDLLHLNLTERHQLYRDGVIQFKQSAVEAVRSVAEQHPFLSSAQVPLHILETVIRWQQSCVQSRRTPNTTVHSTEQNPDQLESLSRKSDSTRPPAAASVDSTWTAPFDTCDTDGQPVVRDRWLSRPEMYMHERLRILLRLDVDVTATDFDIREWLLHTITRMPEVLCLVAPLGECPSPQTFERLLAALQQYPSHLYLAERWTASRYSQSSVLDMVFSGVGPVGQVISVDEAVARLTRYGDIWCDNFRSSPTPFSLGSPLETLALPRTRGDFLWKLWEVSLSKYEQASHLVDVKYRLGCGNLASQRGTSNSNRSDSTPDASSSTSSGSHWLTTPSSNLRASVFSPVGRMATPTQALLMTSLLSDHTAQILDRTSAAGFRHTLASDKSQAFRGNPRHGATHREGGRRKLFASLDATATEGVAAFTFYGKPGRAGEKELKKFLFV